MFRTFLFPSLLLCAVSCSKRGNEWLVVHVVSSTCRYPSRSTLCSGARIFLNVVRRIWRSHPGHLFCVPLVLDQSHRLGKLLNAPHIHSLLSFRKRIVKAGDRPIAKNAAAAPLSRAAQPALKLANVGWVGGTIRKRSDSFGSSWPRAMGEPGAATGQRRRRSLPDVQGMAPISVTTMSTYSGGVTSCTAEGKMSKLLRQLSTGPFVATRSAIQSGTAPPPILVHIVTVSPHPG